MKSGVVQLSANLIEKDLDMLSEQEIGEILTAGRSAGLKLHVFKNKHDDLPRVKRVLGFLKSVEMKNLFDVGSGRGVFIWPCLNAFPHIDILGVDILPHRIDLLETVKLGGVSNLHAIEADVCNLALPDHSYDIVTMLEVLEHIQDVTTTVQAAVQIARKYIVVTAPSKPDNNPEHIQFLTKEVLTDYFNQAGCTRLHFDSVPGHLILVVALEKHFD